MAQKKNEKLNKLKEALSNKPSTKNVSIRLKEEHYKALDRLNKELKKKGNKVSIASVCQTIIEEYIESEMSSYIK